VILLDVCLLYIRELYSPEKKYLKYILYGEWIIETKPRYVGSLEQSLDILGLGDQNMRVPTTNISLQLKSISYLKLIYNWEWLRATYVNYMQSKLKNLGGMISFNFFFMKWHTLILSRFWNVTFTKNHALRARH
jgi:hypothetical protein